MVAMRSPDDVAKLACTLGGLPVLGTRPGSPSANAGIRYGDILLAVNGLPTPDWSSYLTARELDPAEMVVELFRDGEHMVHRLRLDRAENVDPWALLTDLIDARILGDSGEPRRDVEDPEPS